ncbi:flagellin [Comamonas nitrativorans]|uniref:Flagellin n=1 Tax=Comamonas nitrativorans TaxID=108437 RepID=A0ABV9GWR3_9BURK
MATINTNIASINAQRNLAFSGKSLNTTMQRLSSGLRVNSAKDDAAGLAISERMLTQVKGLTVASRNANDGISLAQTAEGALGKVGDMLQRMRELAVQAGNATNSASDRAALQLEVKQLFDEVDRVAKQTNFNGQKVLDGSFAGAVFQVGANSGDNITLGKLVDTRAEKVSTVTYGTTSRTQDSSAVVFHDIAIPKGTLKISTVNGLIELDGIPPANNGIERMGQVVEAINAKTYEHGITAYLTKIEGTEAARIDFMSSASGKVDEMGVRWQTVNTTLDGTLHDLSKPAAGSNITGYETVEFFGFDQPSTGIGASSYAATLDYLPRDAMNAALTAAKAATGAPGNSANDLQLYLDIANDPLVGLEHHVFPPPHTANMDTSIDPMAQALQDYVAAVNAAVYNDPTVPAPGPYDRLNLTAANHAVQQLSDTYRLAVLDSNIKEETGMGIGSNSGVAGEHGIANIDVSTQKGAWVALKKIDSAIDQVNSARATLGAVQTRFETAVNNIDIQTENLSAARGRIVDADFAQETANLARTQILQQAGMAMVAQANQIPQNVLQLLQS